MKFEDIMFTWECKKKTQSLDPQNATKLINWLTSLRQIRIGENIDLKDFC